MAGRKVTILDELGYPTDREAQVSQDGEDLIITLPEDSLYTLVQP
jgi:hypothetical protein